MSDITPLSDKDFDENGNLNTLKDKNVVILFYAEYCPGCRNFKPTFEAASNDLKNDKNIKFASVSTPDSRNLMQRMRGKFPFEVDYIPTVVSYNKGKFFSTYDHDEKDPRDRQTYRTKPDVIDYAKGIGTAKVNFK